MQYESSDFLVVHNKNMICCIVNKDAYFDIFVYIID